MRHLDDSTSAVGIHLACAATPDELPQIHLQIVGAMPRELLSLTDGGGVECHAEPHTPDDNSVVLAEIDAVGDLIILGADVAL